MDCVSSLLCVLDFPGSQGWNIRLPTLQAWTREHCVNVWLRSLPATAWSCPNPASSWGSFPQKTEVSLTLSADVAGNCDMGATHVTVNLICVTTARQPVAAIRLYPCWDLQHHSEDPLGIGRFMFFLIMAFTIRLRKRLAQTGQVAYAWTELN